jgi:hypothetical protein
VHITYRLLHIYVTQVAFKLQFSVPDAAQSVGQQQPGTVPYVHVHVYDDAHGNAELYGSRACAPKSHGVTSGSSPATTHNASEWRTHFRGTWGRVWTNELEHRGFAPARHGTQCVDGNYQCLREMMHVLCHLIARYKNTYNTV